MLEHIEASGSLSQAARDLGMSYRRAWLLLNDLNHALGEPVTTMSVGGAGGGGALLTLFGRKLIAAYRDVEHVSHDVAVERLAWLAGGSASPREEPKAAGRRPVSRSLAKRPPKRRRP